MRPGAALALLLVLAASTRGDAADAESSAATAGYVGLPLGALSELTHGVRGRVFAVDARTLYLQDLHYDGEGPAAYFYVGTAGAPGDASAVRLRDERGAATPLRRYRGAALTLALPDHLTLKDVRWFSLWCDDFAVNFGSVNIPAGVQYPRPARLGALRGVHGVSSDPLVVVDAQTLLLPNFSYDGEAPDAKFWVGRGDKPSPQGIRIPDENGKEAPLRRYERKTIVLTLPGELTVFDIGHVGVWCEAFTVDFGHVTLPRSRVANVPPSLKMLGVSPQSKLNCEVLLDELAFEVRWAVAGDSIVIQLVAKLEDGEYMSFGVSGSDSHSQMVGADVAVAWVEQRSLKGHAVDYYLDAKSQCAGVRGSCPDERLGEKTNSLRLLNAALVNGYSIVTYQRGVKASDQLDRPLRTNGSQPVVWAVGPLNDKKEVSYHTHFLKGDKFIEFGRPPVWNCPMPESEEPTGISTAAPIIAPRPKPEPQAQQPTAIKPRPVPTPAPAPTVEPWDIPAIQCDEPADGVFYAQMGPTGGKHGYPAITGHVGWGISWYINGLLIPEVEVVRGRRYTFVVEGGADPAAPARYHPFYITDDPVGGYFHKSDEEKKGVTVYAGARRARDGSLQPTGVGRLCVWTADGAAEADDFPSFGAYQRALTLVCDEGSPGVVTWTPDQNTPDTVYYQCFTHRHLGWKIRVVDSCPTADRDTAASQAHETRVLPPGGLQTPGGMTPPAAPHPNQVPAPERLDARVKHQKIINTHDYNDNAFSNENRAEPQPDQPISGEQLADVIAAAEHLESRMKEEFVQDVRVPPGGGNTRGPSAPERPLVEGEEYSAVPARPAPPASGRPLTLQSVMRPGPPGAPRPYRRPAPPELRRRPPHRPLPPHMMSGPPRHGPMQNPSNVPLPGQYTSSNGQGHNVMNGPTQGQYSSSNGQHGLGQNGPNGQSQGQYGPFNGQHGQSGTPPSDQHGSASHYGPPSAVNISPSSSHGQSPNHGPPKGQYGSTSGQNEQSPSQHGPPNGPYGSPNNQHGSTSGQNGQITNQYGTSNGPYGSPNGQSGQNGPPSHPGQSSNQHGPQPGKKYNKPPPARAPRPPVKPQYPSKPPQKSSGHVQTIVMGKPAMPPHSQTLSLGKTDIIANQVVKSQITLPGFNEPVAQHSTPQNFYSKPGAGQIILGKPLEHPSPLDQQMAPSVPRPARPPAPPASPAAPPIPIRVEGEEDNVKASDFIGESVTADVSTSAPAVNTGFKPSSIVVESGFKPIIREPLMAGEDRIADFDSAVSANRREDTDVVEDYEESPQYITNQHIFPSEKMTESFEPMFIPSPEDHMSPSIDIPLPTEVRTKEVFPSNHAKEDRPHPVYVKTESELKERLKDMEVPDMLGQSSRVSPQYLPPDNNPKHSQKIINEDLLTTYDGKLVSGTSLTSIPVPSKASTKLYSAKKPTNAELLLRTPQFGKFKGEIPPSIAELESQGAPLPVAVENDDRTTRLKLVNALREPDSKEITDLKAEASEVSEVAKEKKETEEAEEDEDDEEYEEEDDDEDNDTRRRKRETKDTQFEIGAASETVATPSSENSVKNQVDFDQPSGLKGSSPTNYISLFTSAFVIICLRFL